MAKRKDASVECQLKGGEQRRNLSDLIDKINHR